MKKRLKLNKKQLRIVGIVVLVLALPLSLILVRSIQNYRSSAATPDNLETEAGTLSSTGVTKQTDSGASGGSYVLFNKATVTNAPSPTSPPSLLGVGPRYGDSSWPGFSQDKWPNLPSNYVLVPASVLSSSDQATALSNFLNDRSQVPDGTTVVFDRTLLGNGTTYNLTHGIQIGQGGVKRSNITFWMYNSKFDMNSVGGSYGNSRILYFANGAWDNIKVLGGEFKGSNVNAYTYNTRKQGNEGDHGISFDVWTRATVQDAYIHEVLGDGISFYKETPNEDSDWNLVGQPVDDNISYNLISGSGRQCIDATQNTRAKFHHNIIEYCALYAWDAEDEFGTFNVHKDLEITDNLIRYWSVHVPWSTTVDFWNPTAINIARYSTDPFGEITNVTIARNHFEGGAFGFGNPTVEQQYKDIIDNSTASASPRRTDGYHIIIWFGIPGKTKTNVQIVDNVFDLPPDQDRSRSNGADYSVNGNAVAIDNTNGLTITGNDFGNRGVYVRSSTNVNITDVNGIKDVK